MALPLRHGLHSLLLGFACFGFISVNRDAYGEPLKLVSPAGFEDVPGDDWGGLGGTPLRAQHLHDASNFDAIKNLPASQRWLVGIRSRVDEGVTEQFDVQASMTLTIGTTRKADLDVEFSQNLTNPKAVFNGKYRFESKSLVPTDSVYPFNNGIAFQEPYYYDPAQGSLVLDWTVTGNYPDSLRYDATTRENIADTVSFGSK